MCDNFSHKMQRFYRTLYFFLICSSRVKIWSTKTRFVATLLFITHNKNLIRFPITSGLFFPRFGYRTATQCNKSCMFLVTEILRHFSKQRDKKWFNSPHKNGFKRWGKIEPTASEIKLLHSAWYFVTNLLQMLSGLLRRHLTKSVW